MYSSTYANVTRETAHTVLTAVLDYTDNAAEETLDNADLMAKIMGWSQITPDGDAIQSHGDGRYTLNLM